MRIIFYELGIYTTLLQTLLDAYMKQHDIFAIYYEWKCNSSWTLEQNNDETIILFYSIDSSNEYNKVIRYIRQQTSYVRVVALCLNNHEGILAVGNGSDYALLFPFEKKRVMQCCDFLIAM